MEKVTKNNLGIISKSHAYLQTMKKTSVKFQKNWHKTVGGVAAQGTYYIRGTEEWNAENYVPLHFLEKVGYKK